jgi:hypothetical protein
MASAISPKFFADHIYQFESPGKNSKIKFGITAGKGFLWKCFCGFWKKEGIRVGSSHG